MGRKGNRNFNESANKNAYSWLQYHNRLTELAISMFEWVNLPETVDERFLELTLFENGQAVFFEDDVLGFLALQNARSDMFNVYRIPTKRRAFAVNGYSKELTDKNSVIIFNNFLHTNSTLDVEMFARRLFDLDNAIDVNAKAQKTPILIKCDETQRLTMKNLYMQYDGNMPVIYGDKSLTDKDLTVLNTGAPYVAGQLYDLRTQLWNEALTYLGITNVAIRKRERLVSDEVVRNNGGTIASRYSRLESRRQACKQINSMFGLNIDVKFRDDIMSLNENDIANDELEEGSIDE